MKILKRIGLGLLALIALLLIVALFLPKDFVVTREVTVARPKAEVFDYVRHLKNQDRYSKWNMQDPAMKHEYVGTDGQPGFVSKWDGNKDVGKGEQEIKSIKEGERMDMEIRFERPFKNVANAFMSTEDAGASQTKVSWGFAGKSPWPFNLMSAMMKGSMENDLQTGLNNLKKNLESSAAVSAPAP